MDASRFTAVLTVNKVEAQVLRGQENQWDLWIIDEDALPKARELLQRFNANPEASEFLDAFTQAKRIQQQIKQERAKRVKRARTIEVRTQFRDPHSMAAAMQRKDTLTRKVILICVIVFGASLFFQDSDNNNSNLVRNALEVVDDSRSSFFKTVDGTQVPYTEREYRFQHISEGQLWRLITPVFVHGSGASDEQSSNHFLAGFIHIFFNMYWLYYLGTLMEVRFGLKTFAALLFTAALASVVVPLLLPGEGLFGFRGLNGSKVVGMSGVVYALIGFGWCKMKLKPSVGMLVTPFILLLSMAWLFYGVFLSPGNDGISHLAHLVGFLVGAGFAYVHTSLGK